MIDADLGLSGGDLRAAERTYQLLEQVAGRAGRSQFRARVLLQTYMPDNPVIKYASELDIKNFYESILSERKELNYPPYSWLAKIEFSGNNYNGVEKKTKEFFSSISGFYEGLEILGPTPCYLEKLKNNYRFQIVFKSDKTIDFNSSLLHRFIINNYKNLQTGVNSSAYRAKIFFDPLSLI